MNTLPQIIGRRSYCSRTRSRKMAKRFRALDASISSWSVRSIQQGAVPCAANRVSTWLRRALQHRAAMSFRICSQDSACYLLNLGRVQKWTFHSNSQQLQFLRLMDYVGNCPDIFLADPRISKRTSKAHLWVMVTAISHETAYSGPRKKSDSVPSGLLPRTGTLSTILEKYFIFDFPLRVKNLLNLNRIQTRDKTTTWRDESDSPLPTAANFTTVPTAIRSEAAMNL